MALYHPTSNGSTEEAVQTFKSGIRKLTNDTLETRVVRFLLNYQITPQTTTGVSLSELLPSCCLNCHLDFYVPTWRPKSAKLNVNRKNYMIFMPEIMN